MGFCRPRTAGGRPLVGLEFVEKVLTADSSVRHDRPEQRDAPHLPAPLPSSSSWATVLAGRQPVVVDVGPVVITPFIPLLYEHMFV